MTTPTPPDIAALIARLNPVAQDMSLGPTDALRHYPHAHPQHRAAAFGHDLRTALAALQREREAWRPIESAPRTGESILAWDGTTCVTVEWFAGPFNSDQGWLYSTDNAYIDRALSHWQPLPPPPPNGTCTS